MQAICKTCGTTAKVDRYGDCGVCVLREMIGEPGQHGMATVVDFISVGTELELSIPVILETTDAFMRQIDREFRTDRTYALYLVRTGVPAERAAQATGLVACLEKTMELGLLHPRYGVQALPIGDNGEISESERLLVQSTVLTARRFLD